MIPHLRSLIVFVLLITIMHAYRVFDSSFVGQSASHGDNYIGSINGTAITTLLFYSGINAFGINILDFGDFDEGVLTFSNGASSYTAAVDSSNGSVQFFGIITDFLFTSVTLSDNISGESYGLDEVYYGPVRGTVQVPEPGTLSLLLLGLLGIGWGSRGRIA